MNNEEVKNRVNEIFSELDILREELKMIQQDCSHDSYHIGNWSWRPGVIMQVRICNHCQDNIGEPSKEEYKEFTEEI